MCGGSVGDGPWAASRGTSPAEPKRPRTNPQSLQSRLRKLYHADLQLDLRSGNAQRLPPIVFYLPRWDICCPTANLDGVIEQSCSFEMLRCFEQVFYLRGARGGCYMVLRNTTICHSQEHENDRKLAHGLSPKNRRHCPGTHSRDLIASSREAVKAVLMPSLAVHASRGTRLACRISSRSERPQKRWACSPKWQESRQESILRAKLRRVG